MKKSESISELAKAFAKTQQELKQPLKDAKNPFSKAHMYRLKMSLKASQRQRQKTGLASRKSQVSMTIW